jgi:DnaJ-class molecular chaperone
MTCTSCGGQGQVMELDENSLPYMEDCETCNGTGIIDEPDIDERMESDTHIILKGF